MKITRSCPNWKDSQIDAGGKVSDRCVADVRPTVFDINGPRISFKSKLLSRYESSVPLTQCWCHWNMKQNVYYYGTVSSTYLQICACVSKYETVWCVFRSYFTLWMYAISFPKVTLNLLAFNLKRQYRFNLLNSEPFKIYLWISS